MESPSVLLLTFWDPNHCVLLRLVWLFVHPQYHKQPEPKPCAGVGAGCCSWSWWHEASRHLPALMQLQAGGSEHQRSATYLRSHERSEGEICPVGPPSLEQRRVAVLSGPSSERHGTGSWWRPGAPRSVQVPCFVRVLGGGAQPAAPQEGSPVLRKQGRRGQVAPERRATAEGRACRVFALRVSGMNSCLVVLGLLCLSCALAQAERPGPHEGALKPSLAIVALAGVDTETKTPWAGADPAHGAREAGEQPLHCEQDVCTAWLNHRAASLPVPVGSCLTFHSPLLSEPGHKKQGMVMAGLGAGGRLAPRWHHPQLSGCQTVQPDHAGAGEGGPRCPQGAASVSPAPLALGEQSSAGARGDRAGREAQPDK